MSNTRKHDDLVKTFSILNRMHEHLGIDQKAENTYCALMLEQLLERCDCVGTTAIIARTSLEQVVADFMANQDERELEDFLNELAAEARTRGLDPIAYVAHYAEGELGAVKGYATRMRSLVCQGELKPNEESRRILNSQLSEVIGDWKTFVSRARSMTGQLIMEQA